MALHAHRLLAECEEGEDPAVHATHVARAQAHHGTGNGHVR